MNEIIPFELDEPFGSFSAPCNVPASVWGSVILDLVLQTSDEQSIAEAYGLDLPGLEALKIHPPFMAELEKVSTYVDSLGPDAGFILRSRALAEAALPEMGRLVMNKDIHPSVRTKLFNDLVRFANLDPQTTQDKAKNTGPQTTVHINMGGILKASATAIIDVEPTDG